MRARFGASRSIHVASVTNETLIAPNPADATARNFSFGTITSSDSKPGAHSVNCDGSVRNAHTFSRGALIVTVPLKFIAPSAFSATRRRRTVAPPAAEARTYDAPDESPLRALRAVVALENLRLRR